MSYEKKILVVLNHRDTVCLFALVEEVFISVEKQTHDWIGETIDPKQNLIVGL